jgi:hypothetical protein
MTLFVYREIEEACTKLSLLLHTQLQAQSLRTLEIALPRHLLQLNPVVNRQHGGPGHRAATYTKKWPHLVQPSREGVHGRELSWQ